MTYRFWRKVSGYIGRTFTVQWSMSLCFVLAVCQLVVLLEEHGSLSKFYLWTCYEVIKQLAAILLREVSWQCLVTREFKEKTCCAELVLHAHD